MIHIKQLIKFMVFFSMLLNMASCGNDTESSLPNQDIYPRAEDTYVDISEIYPVGFAVEDESLLAEVLKTEYDLKELKSFFQNRCENSIFESKGGTMYFDEVNERFPVEVIRPQGYSVYRVSQGGYFYVFWAKGVYMVDNERRYRPVVYFTVYLSSEKDAKDFKDLKVGENTASDVRAIDEEVEFNFLLSRGTFSYSYLNENEVMQIEYTISDKVLDDYDDLVIKDITIIPRTKGSTCFKSILSKDLP